MEEPETDSGSSLMGTKEQIALVIIVAGLWVFSLIWADYRGWSRGFSEGAKIWKDHAEDMTKIWREACLKAWSDLAGRSV
jgi:hypothetical protein